MWSTSSQNDDGHGDSYTTSESGKYSYVFSETRSLDGSGNVQWSGTSTNTYSRYDASTSSVDWSDSGAYVNDSSSNNSSVRSSYTCNETASPYNDGWVRQQTTSTDNGSDSWSTDEGGSQNDTDQAGDENDYSWSRTEGGTIYSETDEVDTYGASGVIPSASYFNWGTANGHWQSYYYSYDAYSGTAQTNTTDDNYDFSQSKGGDGTNYMWGDSDNSWSSGSSSGDSPDSYSTMSTGCGYGFANGYTPPPTPTNPNAAGQTPRLK